MLLYPELLFIQHPYSYFSKKSPCISKNIRRFPPLFCSRVFAPCVASVPSVSLFPVCFGHHLSSGAFTQVSDDPLLLIFKAEVLSLAI